MKISKNRKGCFSHCPKGHSTQKIVVETYLCITIDDLFMEKIA